MDWRGLACAMVFLIMAQNGVGEKLFAMEPQDQTAVVGTKVILPCRIADGGVVLSDVQWTKDDFGLGLGRELPEFPNYKVIGSDEEGDYSLEIYPVSLDDDGVYQCQMRHPHHNELRSRVAKLTVLVAPNPPKIVQGSSLLTTEDREIELECVSSHGKPAAEITWIDGFGNVLKNSRATPISYNANQVTGLKLFNATSTLKLTPKKEHHNTTFYCQAHNGADRTYKSARIQLLVKYAPKVTVTTVGSPARLVEGDNVKFRCTADANPPTVHYRWLINNKTVSTDSETELNLINLTRAHHDSIIKCEVQNDVGKSEESETLDISYGPRFRNRPQSVQADQGSTVTLSCDVDGNPSPDIVWIQEASDRVVGNSANYSFIVDQHTAGRYFCKATVHGFPEIGTEATVYMKGPPSIVSHRTQFGVPGELIRVECTAYAIPPPTSVIWTYRGEDLSLNNEFIILQELLSEGVKSTLKIKEPRQEHFGVYNCTVVNSYGHDVLEILLKPQKSFPLLLILTGVLGGVAIIIAITMIIILCQRKVKKPPGEVTDVEKQCKESDRSSNISDIKMELRTGSSVSNVHCELDYGGGGSETGSESVATRIGVPLAGPVPLDHRYSNNRLSSGDYPDPVFPPKNDGQNNNGYVPYVDYSRDYNPPPPPPAPTSVNSAIPNANGRGIDPRYSAAYGNPYLRTTGVNLPPPPPLAPAPPPYTALRSNGALPQSTRIATSPTQYITTSQATIKRGTLATHV